ncbi:hypothetical protein [Sphingobium sp. TomTYG45]
MGALIEAGDHGRGGGMDARSIAAHGDGAIRIGGTARRDRELISL